MPIATWIAWLMIALTFAGAVTVCSRLFRFRWYICCILGIITGISSMAALYLYRMNVRPTSAIVTIKSPENNVLIEGYSLRVVGTVNPPSAHVALIVRSETDLRWWVQSIVLPSQAKGSVTE